MKWKEIKLILTGAFTGITGLGFQNLNPYEPIAITHFNAVILGILLFITMFLIEQIIKFGIIIYNREVRRLE